MTMMTMIAWVMITSSFMSAKAGTMGRSAKASEPSVEFLSGDPGRVICRIDVPLTELGNGDAGFEGLSVRLLNEEGLEVTQAGLESASADGRGGIKHAVAEIDMGARAWKDAVTMRLAWPDDAYEIDVTEFNDAILGVMTSAKSHYRNQFDQQGAGTFGPAYQETLRPRYSTDDFSDTLVIGDSVLALSAGEGGYGNKVAESLPGVACNVESGRYYDSDVAGDPDDGMIDIAEMAAGSYDRYVIECGINDAGLTMEMAEAFIETLMRDDVQIFFVNQRVIGGADDMTCSTIREVAEQNERVYEIDWNSLCMGNEEALLLDACHPNEEGAQRLSRLIRDVMTEHASDVMVPVVSGTDGLGDAADVSGLAEASTDGGIEDVLAWRDSEDMDYANLRISTDAEIEGWAQRIDGYLEGTELAGYGRLFAECAARYQVDPRLSPAISTTESGNGRVCVAPYNAWGWGGPGNWASWDSWEEAIEAHVSGLASNGYASMGREECASYCDESYWDGDPSFCLRTEVLKI